MDKAHTKEVSVDQDEQEKIPEKKATGTSRKLLVFLGIFVAVASFVAFLVGGYFLGQKKTPEKARTIIASTQPTQIPTPEISAEWKMYRSKNTTYVFSYPPEYKITEGESVVLGFSGTTQGMGTEMMDGVSLEFVGPVSLQGEAFATRVNSEFEKAKVNAEVTKAVTPIELNKTQGFTYTVDGLGVFTTLFLLNEAKDEYMQISYIVMDPENDGYQDAVNQILASFEFVK